MFNETRASSRTLALCVALFFALSCDGDRKSTCAPGQTLCGDVCVDLSNDSGHCGACDASCSGTDVCSLGRCGATCSAGTDACDGVCRDLDTDLANCGDCGVACDSNQVCSVGSCGTACTGGLQECDGVCRDLRADPLHCGACGTVCDSGEVCADGVCAAACTGMLTDCGGACRDLDADADHCGDCATACADTQVCSEGACGDTCATGLTSCGGDCVDLDADVRHCSACDMPCPIGQSCNGGVCGATQHPPAFVSTPPTNIDEDVAYSYAVSATDADGNTTLMLSASTLPAWLTFVDGGGGAGTLSGTPAQADVGVHSVVLVASDGTNAVEQTFEITVAEVDEPPVFQTTPVLTGGDDVAYAYMVMVTDEEGASVTLMASTLPAWLTLTNTGAGSYLLAGTPTDAEIGSHPVVLEASDGTLTASQSFTITIADVNDLPAFTSVAVVTADEDASYSYAITTTDSDPGTTLVVTASTLPSWLALTDLGGGSATLTGTPTNADVGSHSVVLVVSDGEAMVAQSFTLVVANTNDAPTFVSSAITTATEDALYAYTIVANDEDVGDSLAIAAGSLPAWLTLTDHGDGTATLSGTPGNGDVGDVGITLTVSDAASASAAQSFTLSVSQVDDAPTFTSTPSTVGTQDAAYSYAILTADEEGATLSLVATVLPGWLSFTDTGSGTGTLGGTPGNGDVGTHDVTLSVSDGTSTVTQTFTITVADVNDAPSFTSTPVTVALEDTAYSYGVSATDPDAGATLVLTATGLPSWLVFTDAGNGTATLAGTPTDADVGSHPITVSVTDGVVTVDQAFTIVVSNTNDAPVFTSTASTAATEDASYAYAITTTDADAGTTLVLTAPTLPSWLVFTPGVDGSGTLTGTPTNADVGTHSVTLSVTDGITTVQQSFSIIVANVNDAPTFTSTAVTSVFVLDAYGYAITTSDVDVGDTRTITASALPAWLTLTDDGDGTATLAGTPGISDAGTVNVTLTVDDGEGVATQTFAIVVGTRPPVAASYAYAVIGNTELVAEAYAGKLADARGNVFVSSAVDLLTNASDPDTSVSLLTAALVSAPANGSLLLQVDGSFSYVPNPGFVGVDSFTYALSDGTQSSAAATVTLTVADRVWYVNNLTDADAAGAKNPVGGNGTSADPFDTLAALDAASTFAGDTLFVAAGDGPYDAGDANGLTLLANQRLVGQAADLVVGMTTLSFGFPGLRPTISGTSGHALGLASGNLLAGLRVTSTGANDAVRGSAAAGGTLNDVLVEVGTSGVGVHLLSHTGTFVFASGSITATTLGTSRGLVLEGATAPTVQLQGISVTGTSVGFGASSSAADVVFDGGGIDLTTGGRAVEVVSASAGASLSFVNGASLVATGATGGDILRISASNVDYDATFGPVTLGGAAADDAIAFDGFGAGSSVTFNGPTTLTNVGGDGIEILASGTASFAFGGLTISGAAGTDLRIDGGRPNVTATLAGPGIANTAGESVSVTNTTAATVSIAGGPVVDTAGGIRITGNSGSTVDFASNVTVTPTAGVAGIVATSNATSNLEFDTLAVTTSGATGLQVNTAASLGITNGTLSSTGAIGAGLGLSLTSIGSANVTLTSTTITNSSGGGVSLSSVGGTTRLGSATISTTGGTGILATNGGTLTNTSGTVGTTNGIAVSLTNTTPTLVFSSVSASGAANGIVLNGTGAGSFSVTGTGTTLGSGGTLQNLSGDAVSLVSANNVSLGYVNLTNVGGNGIGSTSGTGVGNLDLTGVRITNAGNAVNEAGIYITSGLTGGCDFSNLVVTGSAENDVEIVALNGALTLNVFGSTFSSTSAALGADGFLLETRGTATANATFVSSTFDQNQAAHLRANAVDNSTLRIRVQGSTFSATPTNDTLYGIVLSNGNNADLMFDVDNNAFVGPGSVSSSTAYTAFMLASADTATMSANIDGQFRNNGNITNQNFGVVVDVRASAAHALSVLNNALGNVRTRGIDYISGVDAGDAAIGNLTVVGNGCSATSAGADTCALITTTQSTSLCTNVRNNVFTAGGIPAVDMYASGPSMLRLESGAADCGGACASAVAHLNARNTLNPGASAPNTTLVAPGSCALPAPF